MRDLWRAGLMAAVMLAASLLAVAMTPHRFMADEQRREKLEQLVPEQFGGWTVDRSIVPVPPSPDLQAVIDATYTETLARTYRNSQGERVMLSMAYGRNQHKGMNTHRPEVCYPAQGFKLVQGGQPVQLLADGLSIPVTQVVAAHGARNEPITYWLVVGDRITHFGYGQRSVAIRYGLSGVIPDGVLVRVSSIDNDNAAAFRLQQNFIADMLTAMSPSQRVRLLGRLAPGG